MNTSFWGGAAVLGLLAAAWQQVQMVLHKLSGLLWVTATIYSGSPDQIRGVAAWFRRNNYRQVAACDLHYYFFQVMVRGNSDWITAVFEPYPGGQPLIFRRGWRFLIVEFNGLPFEASLYKVTLRYPRGFFSLERMCREVSADLNARWAELRTTGELSGYWRQPLVRSIFGSTGHSRDRDDFLQASPTGSAGISASPGAHRDLSTILDHDLIHTTGELYRGVTCAPGEIVKGFEGSKPFVPFEEIYLLEDARTLLEDAKRWWSSYEWYAAHSLVWRRGYLLYGDPGGGKTLFVRHLTSLLRATILRIDLASLTNRELEAAYLDNGPRTVQIVLFEDIHTVFHGQRNIVTEASHTPGVTFDGLLNFLDGVKQYSGAVVVITTNEPDKLDPALATFVDGELLGVRPGRVDRAAYFGPPDEAGRRLLAETYLADTPELVDQLVYEGAGESGAQFAERCRETALTRFWEAANTVGNNGLKSSSDLVPVASEHR